MKKWLILVALLLVITAESALATDSLLKEIQTKYRIPGLGAALIKDGSASTYVAGVRKLKDSTAIQESDKFHLGSCTKAMTATLVAVFVERGKLKWTSTLGESFPDLQPPMNPSFTSVTVEMLTAHRSGITGDLISFGRGEFWKKLWDQDLQPMDGRKLAVQTLLSAAPAKDPGSVYEYSNGNYMIVGAILERLSSESWEDLMKKEIFQPLGMASCGFGAPGDPKTTVPDQPWGHRGSREGLVPVAPDFFADNPPTLGPAGTVHCSMSDWAKFLQLHLDGFNGKDTVILKATSFAKLHQSYPGQPYTYGGWIRAKRDWASGDVLTHAGSNTINYANVWLAPKKNMGLLSVANAGTAQAFQATNDAVTALIGLISKEK